MSWPPGVPLPYIIDAETARKIVEESGWLHRLQEETRTMTAPTIVRPRAGVQASYTGREVAQAYNMIPAGITGKGATIGYIELGGGIDPNEVEKYLDGHAITARGSITVVLVDGAKNASDGPNGADGEVLLDLEVGVSVAPGAAHRVYFAPNTDSGFVNAITTAAQDGCNIISISWGGPESQWSAATITVFSKVFKALRESGVKVFVASGDTGSRDGERVATVDYPASDPNVIACGGTQLHTDFDGVRLSEVAWDDDDRQSASGGGVSKVFPGRQVPDVAGNASPTTGYDVLVDGEEFTVGGTSAVAPLYAGFAALVHEATDGLAYDFLNTVVTNPQACYDVTVGDNGDYRAGPGRDQVTGFGVVDGAKFLAALGSGIPVPVPPAPPAPAPVPPAPATVLPAELVGDLHGWALRTVNRRFSLKADKVLAKKFLAWVASL